MKRKEDAVYFSTWLYVSARSEQYDQLDHRLREGFQVFFKQSYSTAILWSKKKKGKVVFVVTVCQHLHCLYLWKHSEKIFTPLENNCWCMAKIETGLVSLQPMLGYFSFESSQSGIKKPKLLSFLTDSMTFFPLSTLLWFLFSFKMRFECNQVLLGVC